MLEELLPQILVGLALVVIVAGVVVARRRRPSGRRGATRMKDFEAMERAGRTAVETPTRPRAEEGKEEEGEKREQEGEERDEQAEPPPKTASAADAVFGGGSACSSLSSPSCSRFSPSSSFPSSALGLSLIHISEPTRRTPISYAV